jgi:hypothetical protein
VLLHRARAALAKTVMRSRDQNMYWR